MKIREYFVKQTAELSRNGLQSPKLEAEVLIRHALGIDRAEFFASLEIDLSDAQMTQSDELMQRRLEHEPLAYIVGQREFYGLGFVVNPNVLIPRQETELLVELALKFASQRSGEQSKVADVGTGSGAIAVSIAHSLPNSLVYAVDIDNKALEVAKTNAKKHDVSHRVVFLRGNLLEELPERVDMIVSNPPYLRTADIPNLAPEVRKEPIVALDGGADGLDAIRELIEQSRDFIEPNGCILIEMNPDQTDETHQLAKRVFPRARISTHKDLLGLDRVVQVHVGQ